MMIELLGEGRLPSRYEMSSRNRRLGKQWRRRKGSFRSRLECVRGRNLRVLGTGRVQVGSCIVILRRFLVEWKKEVLAKYGPGFRCRSVRHVVAFSSVPNLLARERTMVVNWNPT